MIRKYHIFFTCLLINSFVFIVHTEDIPLSQPATPMAFDPTSVLNELTMKAENTVKAPQRHYGKKQYVPRSFTLGLDIFRNDIRSLQEELKKETDDVLKLRNLFDTQIPTIKYQLQKTKNVLAFDPTIEIKTAITHLHEAVKREKFENRALKDKVLKMLDVANKDVLNLGVVPYLGLGKSALVRLGAVMKMQYERMTETPPEQTLWEIVKTLKWAGAGYAAWKFWAAQKPEAFRQTIVGAKQDFIFAKRVLTGRIPLMDLLFARKKARGVTLTIDQLIGLQQQKEFAKKTIKLLKDKKLRNNVQPILFYGPPGLGKTDVAQIIAKEAGLEFVEKAGRDMRWEWEQESTINDALERSPSILFIDEIDSIGEKEKDYQGLQIGITSLQKEIPDRFVLVIAATNHLENLPQAFKARFKRKIEFTLPNTQDRSDLFEFYAKEVAQKNNLTLDQSIENSYQEFGEATDGLSSRDIKNILEETARNVLYNITEAETELKGGKDITRVIQKKDINDAIETIMLQEEATRKQKSDRETVDKPKEEAKDEE